jgi:hypothetical protein
MRRFLGLRLADPAQREPKHPEWRELPRVSGEQPEMLSNRDQSLVSTYPETDTSGLAETAPLFASAIRNEEIRLDYEGLIERFAAFDHLRQDFIGVTSSPDIQSPVTSLRMSLVEETGQAAPAAS